MFKLARKKRSRQEKTPQQIRAEDVRALKEFLAPSAIRVESDYLQIGRKFARTIFVITYPRYLKTAWLTPIVNLNRMQDIALFIHPTDSSIILKNLTKRLTRIEAEIREREEKGLVRSPILETAHKDIEDLRDRLQQGTERFFKFGLYITCYGDTKKEVNEIENEINSYLENRLIFTRVATFQQSQGFASTLPLNQDLLLISTNMNTRPLSTTFPFVSADLSSNKGILYGINRHNNSLILFDRFSLENANEVIFGKSGGGKSYCAKLEILRYMMLGTDVLVVDPENEYQYLAETVGGTFFKISLNSKNHINPFDLPPVAKDEDPRDVLKENIIDLVNLLRLMLGGFTPEEDALMDRAVRETYASRDITLENPEFTGKTPPLMQDLQDVLGSMEGARDLALKLDKYTKGRFAGFFNNQSNINIRKSLVVFNIRDMEEDLRPVAMYIILNYIWKQIRSELKKRLLFIDEAWWLMQHEESAEFLFSIAKRARKYFLGVTTITQDINDFMSSKYGQPIITNSSLQMLFKQSPATIDVVQKIFNLTDEEKFLVLQSGVGEGLFFAGLKHVALQVVASYSEDQIITSDPEQILKIERAKAEFGQATTARAPAGNPPAQTSSSADQKSVQKANIYE